VSPPEAAVSGTRNVLGSISFRVVMAMIGHPRHRFARCVQDGEEYEDILNDAIQSQRAVSKTSVITNGCPNAADRADRQSDQQYAPIR
jgi:hypothetical protein